MGGCGGGGVGVGVCGGGGGEAVADKTIGKCCGQTESRRGEERLWGSGGGAALTVDAAVAEIILSRTMGALGAQSEAQRKLGDYRLWGDGRAFLIQGSPAWL